MIPRNVYRWQAVQQFRRDGFDNTPSPWGSTPQPDWQLLGNIGDVSPEYGQCLVYVDKNGNYPPEAVYWHELPEEDNVRTEVYRFILEPCTYIDGNLSDNKFHPQHKVWFDIEPIAECHGVELESLVDAFISADPMLNAQAWQAVGEYHGFENLDSYPERMTLAEITAVYPCNL